MSRLSLLLRAALLAPLLLSVNLAIAAHGVVVQEFYDTKRGTALSIHTDPTDQRYGRFSFAILGVGTYVGGGKEFIRPKDGGGVVVNFSGDTLFFAESNTASPRQVRRVRMNAQVGPVKGHATAVLVDDSGASYQMVSHAPPGNAEEVVMQVMTAVQGRDWAALYRLVSSVFTAGMTQEQFVTALSAQEASVGRVVAATVLSKPDIQFSPYGIWFFSVRTRVTFDNKGVLTTNEFIDYYILEADQWKFWFSTTG